MRTIKKSVIAALILSASFGGSALAGGAHDDHAEEEKKGFYVTAALGANQSTYIDWSETIDGTAYNGDIELDNKIFSYDFGIGYDFGKFRAEAAYSSTPAQLNAISANETIAGTAVNASIAADADITISTFFANLYYDLPEYQLGEKTLVPYLGAGLGQSNIDIGTITVAGTETGAGDDSAFSYILKLGTTYEMNEKADLYVEGIYHETSDFSIIGASFDPYKSLGARAGLLFKF